MSSSDDESAASSVLRRERHRPVPGSPRRRLASNHRGRDDVELRAHRRVRFERARARGVEICA